MADAWRRRSPAGRREPEAAGNVLGDLLRSLGIEKPLREAGAVVAWAETVGPAGAARSRALACRGGSLVVEVDTSPWMQELAFLSDEIRKKLNHRLGGELVKEIVLKAARGETAESHLPQRPKTTPLAGDARPNLGPRRAEPGRSTR